MKSGFTQRFAVPIIALSSLLVSVNGLMLRSIESASDWQIVFGRQLCFTPIMLLETLLGPLWVWLVIREVPSSETLIGGAMILAALTWMSIAAIRESQRVIQKIPK